MYHEKSAIGKLWKYFSNFFSQASEPTRKHLFDLAMSILALDGYQSVKFNFEHFIAEDSKYSLNSYYYTLNKSKIDIEDWMRAIIRSALAVPCADDKQPIILSIDDTLIEKYGGRFENRARLFDHAKHNGSNYMDGHCFVSIMMSMPISEGDRHRYIHIPLCYRMWKKEKSKLEMGADMARKAMRVIGDARPVYLCCDSWYPKGAVMSLPEEFANLEIVCNARIDTALYDLPSEKTGKRGRPKIFGDRLSLDDFALREIKGYNYKIGARTVLTNLWKHKKVSAIVTRPLSGGRKRLFLCTGAQKKCPFDIGFLPERSRMDGHPDDALLPLAIYSLRWNIEVSYYEHKTFWSLGRYMLRSATGIEALENLPCLVYSSMILLPYLEADLVFCKSCSPQQSRFLLGDLVRKERFLDSLANSPEFENNAHNLAISLKKLLFSSSPAA